MGGGMSESSGPGVHHPGVSTDSPVGLATVAVMAVAVGSCGAWIAGDYVARPVGLVVFSVVAAALLAHQPTPRAVVARGLLLLAGLTIVTPVFLNLPLVMAPGVGFADRVGALLHPGVLVLWVAFAVIAAALAAAGHLVNRS